MYKLTILFRTPPDISAFEHEWAHRFVPLSEAMPKILRVEVSNIDGGPEGPSEFYKIHEFYFIDRETMDSAMNSPEGTRAGQALNTFAPGLFTLLFAESLEDTVRRPLLPVEPEAPAGDAGPSG
jgi:uncharacterized protein (TIGR02118 family)